MDNQNTKKQVVFSGVQPTGVMTLGNYLGALKNWVKLQDDYDCYYCIVDMHALTVRQDPVEFRKHILDAFALMLACGIDPERSTTFIQSHVPSHAELAWVLNCFTPYGDLTRMTQFKDKSLKHPDNVNAGLFTYPTLMAADILLYQADLVPVGVDQKQHLELTRNIAQRFNQIYGDVFVIPDGYIPSASEGAKIMSLQDPTKKMSKSDENPNAFITILDDKDTIVRKFKRAITDSEMEVRYAEGKDGINNLLTIYSAVTGKSIADAEKEFAGKGYGDFKLAVGEAVADHLQPIRERFAELRADKALLESYYHAGDEKALYVSQKTVNKVYKKIGLIR